MKTKLFIPLLLSMLAGAGFHAAAQSATDQATAGRFRQGEIQVSSHALVAELDAMIDEYDRNGLRGNDINTLKNLRGILSRMSEKDMAKILSLLDQAGAQSDPSAALKVIATAYTQQKGVVVQMKQILSSYENEQEAIEISKSVSDLADRQAANLRTGIETAQWAADNHDDAALGASLEAQTAEQKALDSEMQLLKAKIADFAKDPNNAELATRFNQGVQEATNLAPLLGAAAGSLDQKKLTDAVPNEKSARDKLRHLAHTLAPPQDDVEALQAALEELEQIISQQKQLILTTREALPIPIQDFITGEFKIPQGHSSLHDDAIRNGWVNWPLDKVAQQKEAQDLYNAYKASKIDGNGLANDESDLGNQTEALGQDLDTLAKAASDALNSAVPQMQGAGTALTNKDATGAMQPENVALGDMEMALAALQQQLAAAERAEQNAGDPIADLQELQKETQALIQNQTAVDQNTAAASTPEQTSTNARQQSDLQQKAQEIQQKAAAAAPAAAQSLGAAANNMQQAATDMSPPATPPNAATPPASPQAPQPQPAPQSQQGAQSKQAAQTQQGEAMQNLNKANQALSQQISQLQQAEQQLADAQKYLEQVEKLIEDEQKLQGDTKQTEPQQQKQQPQVQALAPRQQGIQGDTNTLQKALAADATLPDADAMAGLASSASAHMGAAHGQLSTGDATSADPQEGKALDDLYSLKNSLQAQIQADQSQLGSDADAAADTNQSDANAADAIAQAQAEVGQAMNAMSAASSQAAPQAQATDQQAAGEMNQAAQAVGNADAQAAPLPAGAQQAMQAAAADASQAAAEAAAGQNAKAEAAGQSAQQELGQAAAAIAQAQAGIAEAGSPGPGDEPGPPGNTPGPPGPGTGPPGPGTGDGHGNTQITNVAQSTRGGLASGHVKFLNLPERDRTTIQQSQAEKYPQQYAGKVEQYLENLANDSAPQ